MPDFSPDKKYQDRKGNPARYLGLLNDGAMTAWAIRLSSHEQLVSRALDGTSRYGQANNDIIAVPVKTSNWQNIYGKVAGAVFTDRKAADMMMSPDTRIGVLERQFENGVCVDAVFHLNNTTE